MCHILLELPCFLSSLMVSWSQEGLLWPRYLVVSGSWILPFAGPFLFLVIYPFLHPSHHQAGIEFWLLLCRGLLCSRFLSLPFSEPVGHRVVVEIHLMFQGFIPRWTCSGRCWQDKRLQLIHMTPEWSRELRCWAVQCGG